MAIFGAETPVGNEELVEVKEYAREVIAFWRRRTLYSALALLLSGASVIPFSAGHRASRAL
jgi:hypothetical protein